MSVAERLDRLQRRHPRLGLPIAVVYKFVDDQGVYLAALLTHYGFLSLFPLLLLLNTVLGFVLHNDPALRERVLNSALGQFPVIGHQLATPQGISGSGIALAIGIIGIIYGGLGVAQATQNVMNTAWMVPRVKRPNPLKSRFRSLLLLSVVGLAIVGTTVLSALGASADSFGATIGAGAKVLLVAASVVVNSAVFMLGYKVATARKVTFRDVAPGAILAAVSWQILQAFGTAYVGHIVKHASEIDSVFALVLGLMAWIYLGALIVVFTVEVNVVRALHLYPRALLTPFTDEADLTHADKRTYAGQAEAQQAKRYEDIDVSFDER